MGEDRPRRQAQVGDGVVRKRIEFDAETWHALRLLCGRQHEVRCRSWPRKPSPISLKKHGRPVTLKQALKESLRRQPANDPRPQAASSGR